MRGIAWIDDQTAISFLESRGYAEHPTERWCWVHTEQDHDPTALEVDAILYLMNEYDYGGLSTLLADPTAVTNTERVK